MIMPPVLRRTVLVVHVASSVGWVGALIAYLALDVVTATSSDIVVVRGAYTGMTLIVQYAIVPLALTSVAIATINGLGTSWGLFRHYWVVAKLILTLAATGVLLIEAGSVRELAATAAAVSDPRELSSTLPHSIGGLIVLGTALVLSVFKPRGLTRYGWRRQQRQRVGRDADRPAIGTLP